MGVYLHRMGICVFVGKEAQGTMETGKLHRWIGWHRRQGVGLFYVYAAGDSERLRATLQKEINAGLVILLQISGRDDAALRLSAYNDCLKRSKYICEQVAFLHPGEYLAPSGKGNLPDKVAGQFVRNCAAIYLVTEVGIRCIASPLAVRAFKAEESLDVYDGWHAHQAREIELSLQPPVRRIALLSHVMARNGAPLALLSVAKILQGAGYELEVFSVAAGSLEDEFKAMGLKVHVDPSLHGTPLADQPWYMDFDLIFANTALMCGCFVKPLKGTPVLWWLHESPSSLKWCGITKNSLGKIFPDNITTMGVSQAAQNALLALRPDWPMAGNMVLGVEDAYKASKKQKKKNGKLIFMTVGTIEHNKGQDIILNAIEMLKPQERGKCEFWLVGGKNLADKSDYYDKVVAMAGKYPEVKIIDFQPHEKILEMYGQVDALVVPSIEECLPTVAVEAMMMGIACILSYDVGVAYYTMDGENALLFKTGESKSLASIMHDAISDCSILKTIGANGRKLYEEELSLENFRNNLLSKVNECMGVYI